MKLPEGNPSQFRECGDRVMLAESNPRVSLKSLQLRIGDEQDRPNHMCMRFLGLGNHVEVLGDFSSLRTRETHIKVS
jgi:hypothetical protein